jgi:hypothetical protein
MTLNDMRNHIREEGKRRRESSKQLILQLMYQEYILREVAKSKMFAIDKGHDIYLSKLKNEFIPIMEHYVGLEKSKQILADVMNSFAPNNSQAGIEMLRTLAAPPLSSRATTYFF